jgi:DNA repair photolyase
MKGIAKRFCKPQTPVHFDEKELKTNLGSFNTIFVGSSNDLFAESIPDDWILKTLNICQKYSENEYLFQTKNPKRILDFTGYDIIKKSVVCTTLETDCYYTAYMGKSPRPIDRANAIQQLSKIGINTSVTIEPIMFFRLEEFVEMIRLCNPIQVNIGADTGKNNLPEPPKGKVLELIAALEEFTTVRQKTNLSRILK